MDTVAIKTAPPHAPLAATTAQQQQQQLHRQTANSPATIGDSVYNNNNNNSNGNSNSIGAFFQTCK
ncbi:hypothetical protein AWZ03_012712, partial [Drosophila navojoa]